MQISPKQAVIVEGLDTWITEQPQQKQMIVPQKTKTGNKCKIKGNNSIKKKKNKETKRHNQLEKRNVKMAINTYISLTHIFKKCF